MARSVFFRVNEAAVRSFLEPGQPVNSLIYNTAVDARTYARTFIHNRTGELSKRIQVNRPTDKGLLEISSTVFTRSKYALYVHEGTLATPPKGKKGAMTVPKHPQNNAMNFSGAQLRTQWRAGGVATFPAGRPFFTTKIISGQKANPFLAKGMRIAVQRNT